MLYVRATLSRRLKSWPAVDGKIAFLGIKIRTAAEQTIVCLDAKGLWKPWQSFILAGFKLSLPRSAPCESEQTTIDTSCNPAQTLLQSGH